MIDLAHFLVSAAYAQDTVPAPVDTQATIMNYLPFVAVFAIFYVLVIRPQQKKLGEQETMVKALQRGDRVVTTGGIHGKVASLVEGAEYLMLEIADGVEVKILRSNIQGLEAKPGAVVKEGDKK